MRLPCLINWMVPSAKEGDRDGVVCEKRRSKNDVTVEQEI